ncbi:MAG: hypothetical protein QOF35_2349, partial [Actinomycetota bacterium]|nr:hypothetical protein [Actinomycetota bacterium]
MSTVPVADASRRVGSRMVASRRFVFLTVILVSVLGLATGCTSLRPDASGAGSVAQRFHAALTDHKPGAACGLLAPRTLEGVEQSAKAPCPKALTDAGLPNATTVTATDLYGYNARVVLAGDTVFLARFGRQWKVTAAGCKPRPDLPYDCDVKGD